MMSVKDQIAQLFQLMPQDLQFLKIGASYQSNPDNISFSDEDTVPGWYSDPSKHLGLGQVAKQLQWTGDLIQAERKDWMQDARHTVAGVLVLLLAVWLGGGSTFFQFCMIVAVSLGILLFFWAVQQLLDIKILLAQGVGALLHLRFAATAAEGNVVKLLMQTAAKVTHIEVRLMKFFWEHHELKRRISQVWEDWEGSFESWQNAVINLRESFESARTRWNQCQAQMKKQFHAAVLEAVKFQLDSIRFHAQRQEWADKQTYPDHIEMVELAADQPDYDERRQIVKVVKSLEKIKDVACWWKAEKLSVPELNSPAA